jgi:translocation and assembly module TamA
MFGARGIGRLAIAGLLAGLVLAPSTKRADAQEASSATYTVELKPTGEEGLDRTLHDVSTLVSLRELAPAGGFALIERARQDADRFAAGLHSQGYYEGKATITIDGQSLDSPDLVDRLDRPSASHPPAVVVAFTLGPRFTLGQVDISGDLPPAARDAMGIKPGQPAVAADVLAARDRMLVALRDAGHPLARVELPPSILHPEDNTLDVMFNAEPGPVANLDGITITGLKTVNEPFVRNHLLLHSGEQYSPAAIEKARADLLSLGVFSVIRISTPDQLDPQRQLPVTIDLTERPGHAVDAGIAYSTDLGLQVSAGWHDRNLFGNAEQLNITSTVDICCGSAVHQPGYQANIQFIKPDFLVRDQAFEADVGAVRQFLPAYDQTALTQQVLLRRKLSPHWTVSGGVSGVQEQIVQEGATNTYDLIGIPLTARYDSTDNLFDPTRGIRVNVSLTPTYSIGSMSA